MGRLLDWTLLITCFLLVIGVIVGVIILIVYSSKYGHLKCKEEEDGKSQDLLNFENRSDDTFSYF